MDRVTARREARTEAGELGMWFDGPKDEKPTLWELSELCLAAADEWDRANGYVTVRLDDDLRQRLAFALDEAVAPRRVANVLAVLRESAEQEANR